VTVIDLSVVFYLLERERERENKQGGRAEGEGEADSPLNIREPSGA